MELILFIGIPGSGKSTFYKRHFFNSHVRISLDLLKTRNKENKFFQLGLDLQQKMVIDNTNVAISDRKKFMETAKERRYTIIGYFFSSTVQECIARNETRPTGDKVAAKAIYIKSSQLEFPKYEEGFDKLYTVTVEKREFNVHELK